MESAVPNRIYRNPDGAIVPISGGTHVPEMYQTSYRFRSGDDTALNTDSGWEALEDTAVTLEVDTTYRVRVMIENNGGDQAGDFIANFEYNLGGAGWNAITTSSSVVIAVNSAQFDEGDACSTKLLTATTATLFDTGGTGTEDGICAANAIGADRAAEHELAFQIVSGDVVDTDTITMRITDSGSGSLTVTYDVTPSITVSEGGGGGDPEAALIGGKLINGGMLTAGGNLVGR